MGDNTLELDLLLKAQLDGVDKELFDSLEQSAKKTAQQINKAFNFGKVVAGIRLIQSSFSGLTNAVTKMTRLTTNLVTTSVKGFASIAGAILGVTTKVSGLSGILNGIKAGFTGLESSISSAISAIDFKGLIKESIELSSGLTEVQNVIDVVFKDGAKEINAFTENAISQLGMTTLAARKFAGKFGAALTTTGQSTDSILQMSKALTALTADIASFYDIEQDVAAAKLFSGVISGQIRPMRELGVDMTKASLAEYALSKGIQTAYKDMSAAEKQALRFNYVMEKLNFVQGDYARTINSTANQMRLLRNSLKELGSVVGTIINAFFNPLLQVLNRVVVAVTNVVKTIASAMGIDWTLGTGSAGVSGISGVANAYDDLADSAEDLADSEDEVAKSTSKASKEAKKALAPFHKLNVLQNKAAEDSTGKGAGSGLGTIGDLADNAASAVAQKLPSIQDMIKNFFDWLWGLDWEGWMDSVISKINEFFSDLPAKIQKFFDDLQPWIERIVNLFNQFAEGVDWYKIGESVSEVIEGIGRSISKAFATAHWDSYGKAFADFLNGLIDNAQMFVQWGNAIGEGINGAFELIANAAANLHWDTLGENLYRGLQAAFSKIEPENIYNAIYGVLSGITTAINTFFSNLLNDEETQQKIADSIVAMITGVTDYLGSDDFELLVNNIVEFLIIELGKIQEGLDNADTKENIKKGIIAVINGVGELLSSDEFNKLVQDIWNIVSTAIIEFFKNKDIPLPLKIVAAKELLDITGLSDALATLGKIVSSMLLLNSAIGALKGFKSLTSGADDAVKSTNLLKTAISNLGRAMSALDIVGFASAIALLVGTAAGAVEDFDKLSKSTHDLNDASSRFYQNLENDAVKVKDTFESIVSSNYEDKMADFSDALGKSFLFDGLSSKEGEAAANIYKYLVNIMGYGREEAANLARDIADTINGNLNNIGDLSEAERKLVEGYNQFFAKGLEQNQEFADRFKEIATQMSEAAGESSTTSWEQINTLYENLKSGSMTVADLQQMNNKIVADAATQANKEILDSYNYTYEQIEEASKRAVDVERTGVDTVRLTRNESLDEYKEKMTDTMGYLEGAYNEYLNKRKEMEANGRADELTAEQEHQAAIAALKHDGYSQEEADRAANAARAAKYATEIETANADAAKRSTESWKDEAQNLGGALGDIIDAFTTEMAGEEGEGIIPKIMTTGMDELPDKVAEKLEPVKETIRTSLKELGTEDTEDGLFSGVVTSASQLPEQIQPSLDETTTAIQNSFSTLLETIEAEDMWGGFSGWMTNNVWTPITKSLDELKTKTEEVFITGLENIKNDWGEFSGWMTNNVWMPITDSLNKLKNKLDEVFIGDLNNIKNGWRDLETSVTDTIKTIIKGLNDAADAARNLAEELANAASAASSASTSSVYSGDIPAGANGMIIQPNRPQLAIVGDQTRGVNVESPLSTMVEAFRTAAQDLTSAGFNGNITIPIYVDGVLTTQKVITASQMHNYRSNGR